MRWRRWVSVAVLALLVGGVVTHRRELGEAVGRAGSLSPAWLAVLAATAVAGVLTEGLYAAAVTPGLGVRRAVTVQQSTTAANNTVVGSGPVATALRIAMLRSWRVPDGSIGLTLVALNLVASYAVWLVALTTALVGLAGVAPDALDRRVHAVVAAAAAVVLGTSTALWWTLLRRPAMARWLARYVQRVWDRARRRARRLPAVDLAALVERSRLEACALARVHGGRIAVTAALHQLVKVLTPLVVVRAFGIGPDVLSNAEVLTAYGLVRLGVALTPVPAGIGVTELGLAAVLERFGGEPTDVLAVVLVYRALTFLLPLVVGAACFAAWRWERRCLGPAETSAAEATGTGAGVGALSPGDR